MPLAGLEQTSAPLVREAESPGAFAHGHIPFALASAAELALLRQSSLTLAKAKGINTA